MALASWFHFSVTAIKRGDGKSAVAMAAYIHGAAFLDVRTGLLHDYRSRRFGSRDEIVVSFLVLPGGGTLESAEIWNRVERKNRHVRAICTRVITVALSDRMSDAQRYAVVRRYAERLSEEYGIGVDVAIHAPRVLDADECDGQWFMTDHNRNWHGHLAMTYCTADAFGRLGLKQRALDPISVKRKSSAGPPDSPFASVVDRTQTFCDRERQVWCDMLNDALKAAEIDEHVNHRSFVKQGIDREATRHFGAAAAAVRRRRVRTRSRQSNKQVALISKAAERMRRARSSLTVLTSVDRRCLVVNLYKVGQPTLPWAMSRSRRRRLKHPPIDFFDNETGVFGMRDGGRVVQIHNEFLIVAEGDHGQAHQLIADIAIANHRPDVGLTGPVDWEERAAHKFKERGMYPRFIRSGLSIPPSALSFDRHSCDSLDERRREDHVDRFLQRPISVQADPCFREIDDLGPSERERDS